MSGNSLRHAMAAALAIVALAGMTACGNGEVREVCDDKSAHQSIVEGKRIDVPQDLDPLDPVKEIPIPDAETPPRPEGASCLESPPSVLVKPK